MNPLIQLSFTTYLLTVVYLLSLLLISPALRRKAIKTMLRESKERNGKPLNLPTDDERWSMMMASLIPIVNFFLLYASVQGLITKLSRVFSRSA